MNNYSQLTLEDIPVDYARAEFPELFYLKLPRWEIESWPWYQFCEIRPDRAEVRMLIVGEYCILQGGDQVKEDG